MYPKTALIKAAYNFTDKAYIHLYADEKNYNVNLTSKDNEVVSEDEFVNEMMCQTARYEIYLRTKNIRELLTARAMASTLIENPSSNANAICDLADYEKDILSDWFDLHDKN